MCHRHNLSLLGRPAGANASARMPEQSWWSRLCFEPLRLHVKAEHSCTQAVLSYMSDATLAAPTHELQKAVALGQR